MPSISSIRSVRELEQTQRGRSSRRASRAPSIARTSAPAACRSSPRPGRSSWPGTGCCAFSSILEQDVLEGEAGIVQGELLRRYLEAGAGENSASTRAAMISESTSTPSQSKMTRSGGSWKSGKWRRPSRQRTFGRRGIHQAQRARQMGGLLAASHFVVCFQLQVDIRRCRQTAGRRHQWISNDDLSSLAGCPMASDAATGLSDLPLREAPLERVGYC